MKKISNLKEMENHIYLKLNIFQNKIKTTKRKVHLVFKGKKTN